jgi:RimJ/RimL family protein N-acetyltransferase
VKLRALKIEDMEPIRIERNKLHGKGILRTSYMLTPEMQEDWYYREVATRDSRTRYWALQEAPEVPKIVGYGGLENIDCPRGVAEMSLLIFEQWRGRYYGAEAVDGFLDEAFSHMGLSVVFAEVYDCNPNKQFWDEMGAKKTARLPYRIFHNGEYHGSTFYYWLR